MPTVRKYTGKSPGLSWKCFETLKDGSQYWYLYSDTGNARRYIRLVAHGTAPHKANYRLEWNGRWVKLDNDWILLKKYRPSLAGRVEESIKQFYKYTP